MKTKINLFLFILCFLSTATPGSRPSHASEPGYDDPYSSRFEAMFGYELTEDGVRKALEQFDTLDLYQSDAVIDVVGEQKFTALIDILKAIAARTPEDNPNPADIKNRAKYSDERFLEGVKVRVIRARIRCGDPDAKEIAIRDALNATEMIFNGEYAIRSLKYLMHEQGIDVLPELESIVDSHLNDESPAWAGVAAREIIEIERYLEETGSPASGHYKQVLERIESQAPSKLQFVINMYRESAPRWSVTTDLIRIRKTSTSSQN